MDDPRAEAVREVARAAVNLTPGVSVSTYAIITGALPLIVGVLTIILLALQIIYAYRKLRKSER